MFKPKRLLLSLSFFLLSFHPFVFAQQESITITTYYPSPYGSYKELRAQRIAIGDDYIKGDRYCWWPESCITTIDVNADLVVQGNVGIGTTNPTTIFHVSSGEVLTQMRIDNTVVPVQGRIAAGSSGGINRMIIGTLTAHDLAFSPGNATTMTLKGDGTGNVGIGTTGPNRLLTITGPNNDGVGNDYSQLVINATGTYPNNIAGIALNPNTSVQSHIRFLENGTPKVQIRFNNGSTADNKLKIYSWTTSSDFVTFDAASGNVGIGTTSPAGQSGTAILDVSKSSTSLSGEVARFQSASTTDPDHYITVGISGAACSSNHFISSNNDGSLRFGRHCIGPDLTISASGNVGIGTTSPGSYTLNVAGTINTSGGCTGCSDARWKTNIAPISAPLDKIMALTGVQFNWKTKEYPSMFFQEGLDYGLVAQDVEKALPEIVYEDNGYKYIRYDRLSAILIEAAKEQQKEIKEQRKEINDLKEELAQQKAEIASLKGKL